MKERKLAATPSVSRLLVELSILLADSRGNSSAVLKDAATTYKWTPKPSRPR
jgi:hypothetical protein